MQTVLNGLEFNHWVMMLEFEKLGRLWIKGYYHTSPTHVFQPEEREDLELLVKKCQENPKVKDFQLRVIEGYYPVAQLDVPIRLMGPRHYSLTQIKDFFNRNELAEDEVVNARLKGFAKNVLNFLIKEAEIIRKYKKKKPEEQKQLQERYRAWKEYFGETNFLEIDNLRDYLVSRPQIQGAPDEKRERFQETIEDLLAILEQGHPLNCRLRKDKTPKVAIPGPLPEAFIKGYYTEGAEQNIAPKGSRVDLLFGVEVPSQYRNDVGHETLVNFIGAVKNYLASRGLKDQPGNLTRIRKNLEKYFADEKKRDNGPNGENCQSQPNPGGKNDLSLENGLKPLPKIKSVGGELSYAVIESWQKLQQVIKNLVILGKDFGGLEVKVNYGRPELELWFEKDLRKYIKFVRMPTADEIRQEIWWLVDWENFEFNTEHAAISMGAMGCLKDLEFYGGNIKARYPINLKRIGDFRILDHFGSAEEIVVQTRDEFLKSKATVAVAFNATYDLLEPKKYGDFSIGSLEREPRKVSTVPFFERIGIPARDVLDPFKLARILYDFLPNRKLVTIAKKISEEESSHSEEEKGDLEKIINYRHGRELEIGRRTGRWDHLSFDTKQILEKFHGKKFEDIENKVEAAGQLQAHYVAKDLEKLVALVKSQRFQKCMDDISYLSQLSQVDFFLLMHDPKRLDRWLNRIYFQKFGTWRAEMLPRYKNITEAEERAHNYFSRVKDKFIPEPKERGMFENVYKTSLSLGRLFREEIRFFMKDFQSEMDHFYSYIDSHRSDQLRSHFLSKYENAVFDWLYADYMFYCHTEHRYREKRKEFASDVGDYLDNEHGMFSILKHRLTFCANESKSRTLHRKLREGQLDQQNLNETASFFGQQFIEDLHLKGKELQSLFNLWLQKNNQANRILQVYDVSVQELEDKFRDIYRNLLEYLEANQLKLVHKQNNFLYLQGNKDNLLKPECPLILVDELKKVFVTEHPSGRRKNPDESDKKIYYPRCGFWDGLKDEEETTFRLNLFEMEADSTFLEDLFSGNLEKAKEELSLSLDAMASHKVPLEQLVWYSKSKGQYHAFENGKKITFINPGTYNPEDEKPIKKDENGREYYIEESRHRKTDHFGRGYYATKEKNIYLMNISDLNPDWNFYCQRVSERAEILLEPLLGIAEAKLFVQESQRPAREFLGYDDISVEGNLAGGKPTGEPTPAFALTPDDPKKARNYQNQPAHRKPKKWEQNQPLLPFLQKPKDPPL